MRTSRCRFLLISFISLGLAAEASCTAIDPAPRSRAGVPIDSTAAEVSGVSLAKVIRSRAGLLRRFVQSPLLESRSPADVEASRPSLVRIGRELGELLALDARRVPAHPAAGAVFRASVLASGATSTGELEGALRTLEAAEREFENGPEGPRMSWRDYLAPISRMLHGLAGGGTPFPSPAAELLVLRVAAQGLSLGLSGLSTGGTALPPRVAIALDVIGAEAVAPLPEGDRDARRLVRSHRERLLEAARALTGLLAELETAASDPARRLSP